MTSRLTARRPSTFGVRSAKIQKTTKTLHDLLTENINNPVEFDNIVVESLIKLNHLFGGLLDTFTDFDTHFSEFKCLCSENCLHRINVDAESNVSINCPNPYVVDLECARNGIGLHEIMNFNVYVVHAMYTLMSQSTAQASSSTAPLPYDQQKYRILHALLYEYYVTRENWRTFGCPFVSEYLQSGGKSPHVLSFRYPYFIDRINFHTKLPSEPRDFVIEKIQKIIRSYLNQENPSLQLVIEFLETKLNSINFTISIKLNENSDSDATEMSGNTSTLVDTNITKMRFESTGIRGIVSFYSLDLLDLTFAYSYKFDEIINAMEMDRRLKWSFFHCPNESSVSDFSRMYRTFYAYHKSKNTRNKTLKAIFGTGIDPYYASLKFLIRVFHKEELALKTFEHFVNMIRKELRRKMKDFNMFLPGDALFRGQYVNEEFNADELYNMMNGKAFLSTTTDKRLINAFWNEALQCCEVHFKNILNVPMLPVRGYFDESEILLLPDFKCTSKMLDVSNGRKYFYENPYFRKNPFNVENIDLSLKIMDFEVLPSGHLRELEIPKNVLDSFRNRTVQCVSSQIKEDLEFYCMRTTNQGESVQYQYSLNRCSDKIENGRFNDYQEDNIRISSIKHLRTHLKTLDGNQIQQHFFVLNNNILRYAEGNERFITPPRVRPSGRYFQNTRLSEIRHLHVGDFILIVNRRTTDDATHDDIHIYTYDEGQLILVDIFEHSDIHEIVEYFNVRDQNGFLVVENLPSGAFLTFYQWSDDDNHSKFRKSKERSFPGKIFTTSTFKKDKSPDSNDMFICYTSNNKFECLDKNLLGASPTTTIRHQENILKLIQSDVSTQLIAQKRNSILLLSVNHHNIDLDRGITRISLLQEIQVNDLKFVIHSYENVLCFAEENQNTIIKHYTTLHGLAKREKRQKNVDRYKSSMSSIKENEHIQESDASYELISKLDVDVDFNTFNSYWTPFDGFNFSNQAQHIFKNILQLDLPSDMTSFNCTSLEYCEQLINITFPSNLTQIDNSFNCPTLLAIDFANTRLSTLPTFDNIQNVQSFILPQLISSLPRNSISNVRDLHNVNFTVCTQLQNINSRCVVPISTQGPGRFDKRIILYDLDLSACSNLRSIDKHAFIHCVIPTNALKLPSNLRTVGTGAFHVLPFTNSTDCFMTDHDVVQWRYTRDHHRWNSQETIINYKYEQSKILDFNRVTNITTENLVQVFAPNDFTHCLECSEPIGLIHGLEQNEDDHYYVTCPQCVASSEVLLGFTRVVIRHSDQYHLLDSSNLISLDQIDWFSNYKSRIKFDPL